VFVGMSVYVFIFNINATCNTMFPAQTLLFASAVCSTAVAVLLWQGSLGVCVVD